MVKRRALAALAIGLLLAGCASESTTPTPLPPPLVRATVYAYHTDTDATEFVDVEAGIFMTATTVDGSRPVNMFKLDDGTMSDSIDIDLEHTPWEYSFYKASEPITVTISASTILLFAQDLTFACHAILVATGAPITLDEATGPGPVGVTCEFVVPAS